MREIANNERLSYVTKNYSNSLTRIINKSRKWTQTIRIEEFMVLLLVKESYIMMILDEVEKENTSYSAPSIFYTTISTFMSLYGTILQSSSSLHVVDEFAMQIKICVVSMLSKICTKEARLEGTSCKTRGSFHLLERGEVTSTAFVSACSSQ